MAIFVTGSTGYLGSYVLAGLLREHVDVVSVLVRAKSDQEARERLWQSLQLHMDFPEFIENINLRVKIFRGDLTAERFGRVPRHYFRTLEDRVIPIAAQDFMISAVDIAMGNLTHAHTLATSHAPHLSQPDAVAEAVLAIASGQV